MLPNEGEQRFESVIIGKKEKIVKKKAIKKLPLEGYKWPYYDSYVPNLGMKDKDKKIVRRGIQRQYFPNDERKFNEDDMKKRKVGIKKIEHQYIERIKSASSPTRKAARAAGYA